MFNEKTRVSTGLTALDRRLDGLFIGDNVIWYDEAGSLAFPFVLNLIRESQMRNKPIIYVTFDRSPKNLLEELGPLAETPHLTILDCFTHGKGDGSAVFSKFYEKNGAQWPYQIVKINEPARPEKVAEAIYGIHQKQTEDVRFVFESLTGMQDLWEGEESVLKFYSRSCPRLYELETIAYWIIEKGAHSNRLKAHINQIAQVAIELGIRRGKSALTILKAHNRRPNTLDKAEFFWVDGIAVAFDADQPMTEKIDLGGRLKSLRTRQGLSQKELAAWVGVTPSTISQIESNLIYPSLPALIKLAQVLVVDVAYFFHKDEDDLRPVVFSGEGKRTHFAQLPKGSIEGRQLLPMDLPARVEPYLLEIPPGRKLGRHFFAHKGEEFGYLLEGELEVTIKETAHHISAGHVVFLSRDIPTQWKNLTDTTAKLLWMKLL
ncbi:MAG: helix-turn-helix domain-containing protein [Desulfatitalea sp.]|nr:helix-turn-helix domain-containing protein [Desulfatitalea sp.]NNK00321.1 helix-turn-helix domain-containing protein [Desulfatitalea sp.]